jgi:hypothetical protein
MTLALAMRSVARPAVMEWNVCFEYLQRIEIEIESNGCIAKGFPESCSAVGRLVRLLLFN